MSDPAVIRVFTFKEGLLSRLAHDLRLTLGCFELELTDGSVRGRFELDSLHVDGAVMDGRLDEGALSGGDRAKIEASMREDVLDTVRHPRAELSAKLESRGAGGMHLAGTLELAGRTAPVAGALAVADRITGRFEIVPSRWGIKPFKALGGALKIQDRVVVEVDLPAALEGFDPAQPLATAARWQRP